MEELTGLDARFIYSETPTAHMHTLKIAVIDLSGRPEALSPTRFIDLMEARLDRLPALRRRMVQIPHRLGHPVWVEDPEFDLSRHVRWRVVARPGNDHELAALVSEIASTQLPRSQPLWELTVVEGLEGGLTAFVVKLHHSMADGGAAVAMLENAFVIDDADAYSRPAAPEPLPTRHELYRQAARSRRRRVARLPRFASQTGTGLTAAGRARRDSTVSLPVPFSSPRTSLNVSLERGRTFAMTALPLSDLQRIKRTCQVTFNDVFLAVCGGALRRYLDRRGELPRSSLIAGVPVATHLQPRHFSGNHVDNLMLPVASDIADPAERVRSIHEAVQAARRVREALGTDLFEYRAGLTPPHLYPLGIRLWARTRLANWTRPPINLVASNVVGPRRPLELDGGVVTALYSVGPILEGIGLNITAWSYVDRLYVSVLGCPASLPEPWTLIDDLTGASDELRTAVLGNRDS
jgi:diacylglycerol O-acyltransferase / wax synthase